MCFRIQASCPRYTHRYDEEDEDLSSAIETIFPMMTEDVIMYWKCIPITLEYKYDISWMIDDILLILEKLRSTSMGVLEIHWSSDTFANIWSITWSDTKMKIDSKWNSVVGNTEEILQSAGPIIIEKEQFANEWKRVFSNIIKGLKLSGYSEENLLGMKRLVSEYNLIKKEGVLYE